jgi:hypothetical protein
MQSEALLLSHKGRPEEVKKWTLGTASMANAAARFLRRNAAYLRHDRARRASGAAYAGPRQAKDRPVAHRELVAPCIQAYTDEDGFYEAHVKAIEG